MGVVISKPAINLREQLTELKAQQGYEERQFHFDNLVTNGTFDTDVSGWTKLGDAATTFTYDTGSCLIDAATNYDGISQLITGLTVGQTYAFSADFTLGTSSACHIRAGIIPSVQQNGGGTLQETFVADSTSLTIQVGSGTSSGTLNVDNVSIYTSDGTGVAFPMPKGWKPLHVYDDGVLQREGSAEDYEVTFDGFNYYVKPTVANPGARNTVIGVRA